MSSSSNSDNDSPRKRARTGGSGSPPEEQVEVVEGGEGDTNTIRGRGGFRERPREFSTIPPGVSSTSAGPNGPGKRVDLLANYIKVTPMADRDMYMYRVDFEPQIESLSLRRRVFYQKVKPEFGVETIVTFDGMSDARCGQLLDRELVVNCDHPTQPEIKITIKVKKVGKVETGSELIRVYNMNMKNFLLKLGFFRVSNNGAYVHPRLFTPVGPDLITLRGYRTSANVHEGGTILMNLESVHKLMQKRNVLAYLASLDRANFKEVALAELKGKLCVTNYNHQVYRIEDIAFDRNPKSTFRDEKQDRDVSFIEYYKTRHDREIKDPAQPMLIAVPNNRRRGEREQGDQPQQRELLLVPELCNIAGLTETQRNDNRLKIDLIKCAQIPPTDRVGHMLKFLDNLHENYDVRETLRKWGYSYEKTPVQLRGRELAAEGISLGRFVAAPPDKWPRADASGGFDTHVLREKLAKPAQFKKLVIMISRQDAQHENQITSKLRTGFEKIGLTPERVELARMVEGDNVHHFVQYLRKVSDDTTATMVILPRQNKERYDAIKKFAAVERGMITQVVTGRLMTDDRKASGAAIKIGVQVAAKIGGEPWYVHIPLGGTMVCGYDTYHDTLQRGRSFGAFVASMNDKHSRWFSRADQHSQLSELSAHLADNFGVALRKYREVNGKFPERVFIYRDGVSDGEISHVFNFELKGLLEVIGKCDKGIRLTFIIVNKRIGARFYLKCGTDRYTNPAPGTIIDDVVTRQERYDFYLVSQSTRHGTVAPTYYNIIHDESGLSADKHQMLAFKMCFLYYNWTGTVRVPAPCQYAHKLALLCGEHLHDVPHDILGDRLHFL